jgi:hypothetical protein
MTNLAFRIGNTQRSRSELLTRRGGHEKIS